ncbi:MULTISPECIES: metallophosphoesterase [unclassified Sphingomonas]|jgi:manganese-dependent ADP-ribose/CDP-alcohol diphosphatase|uniref:metallophosphoesterase n=1 Tax=unclassified Sphingomonas TaxID=196159 RepID=UPI000AE47A76|nr:MULTISPECIES: metallophosphoesterase [unclassified Sphingomonas]
MRWTIMLALAALGAAPAPSAERPAFSIGAIADAQYADAPDNGQRMYHTAPGKFAAAVADFNRQRLAFVVHLGDFIDKDWASYDAMLPIARRLRHPVHFVLGNHEFAVDDAHKPQVPAKLGMPRRYYSFERQGWLFLVTDGNDLSSYAWPEGSPEHKRSMAAHAALYPDKPLWDGGIGGEQLAWIDAELARADKHKLKVMLFSHFPVWPENPHNLWNAPAVMTLLERHPSAKIWLDGHNHDGNYGVRAGIHYVNMKAMLDTPETSYARLDFFADRVELHGTGRQGDLVLRLRPD